MADALNEVDATNVADAANVVDAAMVRSIMGGRLKSLREARGINLQNGAKLVEMSPATLNRLERGHRVRFKIRDIRDLLLAYNASERDTAFVMGLAEDSRSANRPWYHNRLNSTIPDYFGPYVMFENSANRLRIYQHELVPGLLQTRGYAEETHRVPAGYIHEDEIPQRVQVRLERQSLLTRGRAPRLEVVLSEAVLRRVVGGREVMCEQLAYLVKVAGWGNVSIRVLPFSAGMHGGMAASAPFILLDFPINEISGEPLQPPLAYVDAIAGALYLQEPDQFAPYELAWKDIDAKALDETASLEMIRTAMEGLHQ